MSDTILDFYRRAVHHVFHDVVDIQLPACSGQLNNLLFVKTNDGDYVAKFNPHEMALKNRAVSRIVANAGIPVPEVQLGMYQNTLFEYYPMIRGKTLFERISDGMTPEAIRCAFDDILIKFIKMKNLHPSQLTVSKCTKAHETVSVHVKTIRSPVTAMIYRAVIYALNHYSKQDTRLYHYDINPKNVIVDEHGRLISFLDLDGMAICTHDFAFRIIVRSWVELGFNPSELYDRYEFLSGAPVNRRSIETMRCGLHACATALWPWRRLQNTK